MRIALLIPFLVIPAPAAAADDFADTPDFAHAMAIQQETVDGFPVVMHYGDIRPDFEDRTGNPYRSRASLDGPWSFRFDPDSAGLAGNWAADGDDRAWTAVTVPHCWDTLPGGRFWDWSDRSVTNPPMYDGVAWYRREFDAPPAPGKRQRLEFLGIPHRVSLFLNGDLLARHEGGGQPFTIDVTGKLRKTGNILAVRIVRLPNYREKKDAKGFDEIYYIHTRNPKAPDNWPYGGIPRSVSLVTENPLTIRKTQVRIDNGKLEAAVCIGNHDDKARSGKAMISADCIDAPNAISYTIAPGGYRVLRFSARLKKNAQTWSPENPRVYRLTATLGDVDKAIDQLRSDFGIREFRTRGGRFFLNGNPIFLKGASVYEEDPQRGNALTESDHQRVIKLAAAAKANFLRLHVTQRAPAIYQLADRAGIMTCAEWGGFWYRPDAMAAQTADKHSLYRSLERCAVWDLINHPSVVIWGLNNECDQFCPEYEPFLKMSHEIVTNLDWQQRPVTWAAWHPHKGQPHFEQADAVGFNEYRGAMDPFQDLEPDVRKVIEQNPDKPLIIMENGAWSPLGNRGPVSQGNTEDWQADLLRRQHEALAKLAPPLSGFTYWLLADYRSRKPYTAKESANGYSRMGLYNEFGKPKLVRDTFRDLVWPVR